MGSRYRTKVMLTNSVPAHAPHVARSKGADRGTSVCACNRGRASTSSRQYRVHAASGFWRDRGRSRAFVQEADAGNGGSANASTGGHIRLRPKGSPLWRGNMPTRRRHHITIDYAITFSSIPPDRDLVAHVHHPSAQGHCRWCASTSRPAEFSTENRTCRILQPMLFRVGSLMRCMIAIDITSIIEYSGQEPVSLSVSINWR